MAQQPASRVVTLPTQTVAAAQVSHVSHFSHFGMPKLNTAAHEVPELLTQAELHGARVQVDPTETVAACHGSH